MKKQLLILFAFFGFSSSQLYAQQTFTETTDALWSNTANWSGVTVPASTEKVTITINCDLDGATVNVNAVTLIPTADITISNGNLITKFCYPY